MTKVALDQTPKGNEGANPASWMAEMLLYMKIQVRPPIDGKRHTGERAPDELGIMM